MRIFSYINNYRDNIARLSKHQSSTAELMQGLNMSESSIECRKREAAKLFGILMWKYALRREREDII